MEVNKAYKELFTTDKKFIITWGGAGSGKSKGIAQRLVSKVVSQHYCKPICLRKNFNSIKDSVYALLIEVITEEQLLNQFHITISPLSIKHIKTGNEFLFRGMKDIKDQEKIKSIVNPTDVWMEEANEFDVDDFRQLRLRLRGSKGFNKQLFMSFNGVDEEIWINKDVMQNKVFKDRLLILNTTYKDNKFLEEDYIKELELLIDEDENYYNIYVLGKWGRINFKGKIYKNFDSKLNVCDYVYNPMLPIDVCCDFNIDPMKWALIQEVNGIDYVFDEIVGVDVRTENQCETLLEKYPNKRIQWNFYGDYSGTFPHTSSPTTDYDMISAYFPKAKLFLQPNPFVVERIDVMNWRLKNKNGLRRLMVSEKCVNVIYSLMNDKFLKGKKEEDKRDEKYDGKNPITSLIHITSAIGYRMAYKYSIKNKTNISHGKFIGNQGNTK